jgi:hypothetical protein
MVFQAKKKSKNETLRFTWADLRGDESGVYIGNSDEEWGITINYHCHKSPSGFITKLNKDLEITLVSD